ncbi:MAG: redoxin domain-containing protein, partial [Planctomyces sp.]
DIPPSYEGVSPMKMPSGFLSLGCLQYSGVILAMWISAAATGQEATTPAAGAAGAAAAAAAAPAEAAKAEPVKEGHSVHGEVFNEGPRQAAWLMPGMGAVRFPATSVSEEARLFVQQGVAQLHGYWYFESERSFRQAAMLDPDCAIAYWGMAMSNRGNPGRAKGFIAEGMKRREKASRREKLLIEAFDRLINAKADNDGERESRANRYVSDLEDLLLEFPDDIETKTILCEFFWAGRREGLKMPSQLAVDAMIQEVLDVEPLHPVHHFRIHLWDGRKPEKALQSSALGGLASPGIAHMWHMPGHIYSRLRRYHDAVWQQEASARVDHAHMMRDRVLPDQIHNFAHNNEWCIRNMIAIGRAFDAEALAGNMLSLPQHPKYNDINRIGSFRYGRERLLEVLEAFERWDRIAALQSNISYADSGNTEEDLKRDRATGAALAALGRTVEAAAIRAKLQASLDGEKQKQSEAVAEAEKKAREAKSDDKAIEKARKDAEQKFAGNLRRLEKAIQEIDGRGALAAGDAAKALELLTAAEIPVEQLALLQQKAGKTEDAIKKIADRVNSKNGEVLPLAAQTEILFAAGRRDEAKASFEKLRKLSSTIDLAVPPMARLAPIAAEFGFPADWRLPAENPGDLGVRPELDALGPFRWSPSAASEWTLPGVDEMPRSLSDYRGRPVVVVFYLGYGCLHCAEQLKAIAKDYQSFREAGLEVIAISTDKQVNLKRALENLEGGFPFPLAADPELGVFRKYRCYDDFEKVPLHGTFLVDAKGRVRWQDISFEPFMNTQFLVKESKRLLSFEPETAPAVTVPITVLPAVTSAGR